MNYFENVKKNFGFGCMRLPMKNGEVDYEEFCRMTDYFLEEGFNYFDTAHGYIDGRSEKAIAECLVKRHPRDSYILADKLTDPYFFTEAEVRPFFESQLKILGVDYLDFYLMHAQNHTNYEHFKKCRAYEQAYELKKEGKIRHIGFSFHDSAEVLDRILSEHPEMEFVQIQFNYVDYEDPAVQSRKCYEVCCKHGKPVIIMEPVKGGNLINLPGNAGDILKGLGGGSNASYAIRFAAGFEGVFMVLSGMSNMEQMRDNLSFMKDFKPLNAEERSAIEAVCRIYKAQHLIPCTSCRYCTAGCPEKILIPDLFSCMNAKNIYHDWNAEYYYREIYTVGHGKASDCIKCGKCERACPQNLPIRQLLEKVAREFETPKSSQGV